MNKSFYIIAVLSLLCLVAKAQNPTAIVDDLNAERRGQGKVFVYNDDIVQAALNAFNTEAAEALTGEQLKVRGYRIAVFSDSRSSAQQEAKNILKQIKAVYPDIEGVITYQAPRWRLRVGNYLTEAEARAAIAEMKNNLPAYIYREMKPVADTVKRTVGE